jgi:hypothetical protein
MLVQSRTTEKTSAVVEDWNRTPIAGLRRTLRIRAPDTDATAFAGAQKVEIAHPDLKHDDRCPECGRGNGYGQKEPKVLVRIVGQAPLAATVYSLERLRCGACGQVFTAQEPGGYRSGKVRRDGGNDRATDSR